MADHPEIARLKRVAHGPHIEAPCRGQRWLQREVDKVEAGLCRRFDLLQQVTRRMIHRADLHDQISSGWPLARRPINHGRVSRKRLRSSTGRWPGVRGLGKD